MTMPQNRRTLRRIIKAPSTRTPKNRRRRHCRLGLRALGLRARVAPCSCGARDRRASVENAGLPLVLSYCTLVCRFFRRKNMQWKSGRIPFYTLARKKRPDRRGNDAALPCGQGALPVCGGDAVCPCGQRRFRVGAPDFGLSRGKAENQGVLPIKNGLAGAPERRGKGAALTVRAFLCEHPARGSAQDHLPTPSASPRPPQPSRGETGGLCPHPLKGSIP